MGDYGSIMLRTLRTESGRPPPAAGSDSESRRPVERDQTGHRSPAQFETRNDAGIVANANKCRWQSSDRGLQPSEMRVRPESAGSRRLCVGLILMGARSVARIQKP
jgi:hypothetical protein